MKKDMQWGSIHIPICTSNRRVHVIGLVYLTVETQNPQIGEGLPHYYTQEEIDVIAQNSPYLPTYNPSWKNHPNLS